MADADSDPENAQGNKKWRVGGQHSALPSAAPTKQQFTPATLRTDAHGWQKFFDPFYNKYYWYQHQTKKQTWERPDTWTDDLDKSSDNSTSNAAVKLQSAFRGKQARQSVSIDKNVRVNSKQSSGGYEGQQRREAEDQAERLKKRQDAGRKQKEKNKEETAALRIQALQRGKAARKSVTQIKMEKEEVQKKEAQDLAYMKHSFETTRQKRREEKEAKDQKEAEEKAAQAIQRVLRGKMGRKTAQLRKEAKAQEEDPEKALKMKLKKQKQEDEEWAAQQIQRVLRGKLGRKRATLKLEEQEAQEAAAKSQLRAVSQGSGGESGSFGTSNENSRQATPGPAVGREGDGRASSQLATQDGKPDGAADTAAGEDAGIGRLIKSSKEVTGDEKRATRRRDEFLRRYAEVEKDMKNSAAGAGSAAAHHLNDTRSSGDGSQRDNFDPSSPMSVSTLQAMQQSGSEDFFPAAAAFLQEATELNLKGLPGITEGDIRKAFNELDYDQNGYVGTGELRYMLMLIGENPTDAELDEMLRMVDCGGDGQASFLDFFEGLFVEKSPVPAEMAGIVNLLREAKVPTLEEEIRSGSKDKSGRVILGGPSVRDMDLLLKGASGFLYKLHRAGRNKGNMPPTHNKRPGARRARPDKEDAPLALSPKASREARRLGNFGFPGAQGRDAKGKGKGKDAHGGQHGGMPRGR